MRWEACREALWDAERPRDWVDFLPLRCPRGLAEERAWWSPLDRAEASRCLGGLRLPAARAVSSLWETSAVPAWRAAWLPAAACFRGWDVGRAVAARRLGAKDATPASGDVRRASEAVAPAWRASEDVRQASEDVRRASEDGPFHQRAGPFHQPGAPCRQRAGPCRHVRLRQRAGPPPPARTMPRAAQTRLRFW